MTTLKNTLRDSNNGLDYTMVNGYYLPNLTVAAPTEQHPTGRWGRLHKRYLKEHHPIRYNQLLLSGELGSYLAKLDKQAEEQLALTVRQMQDAKDRQLEKKAKTDKIALKRITPIKQGKITITPCFIGVIL